jgi:hypothetical protein
MNIEEHKQPKSISTPSNVYPSRDTIAKKIIDGEADTKELLTAKVVTTTLGTHISLRGIFNYGSNRIAVAPSISDANAAFLHREKAAFVMSPETLSRFECKTVFDFIDMIKPMLPRYFRTHMPSPVEFGEIR